MASDSRMCVANDLVLRVDRVVKRYGAFLANDNVSFDLHAGEVLAVLGPNGAGKTTLFRMLIGHNFPDGGAIRYFRGDGAVSMCIPPGDLGYLPEERGLYQESRVDDVLVYLAQLRGASKRDAQHKAEKLLSRINAAALGRKRVRELSKGNQQKIQLVACLMNDPRVLVLDEPTSGLDPQNQEQFISLLRELRNAGTAVLLSAHQLALVERVADRVLILSGGRVVEEVSARSGLRRRNGYRIVTETSNAKRLEEHMAAFQGVQMTSIDGGKYAIWSDSGRLPATMLDDLIEGHFVESLSVGRFDLRHVYLNAMQRARATCAADQHA